MKHLKDNYNTTIQLRCIVCGMEDSFEHDEEKSYIKCTNCGKEYFGGYKELVECNQHEISAAIEKKKTEITQDAQKEITNMFRKAFKGSKFLKFK